MSKQLSNPFSTGGGGPFFEAKVQASFLLYLLIGGRVPCLPSGDIESVRLQAKQAGFDTDDVVIKVRSDSGAEHRLLAQIKHHAAIAVNDQEFSDSLASAWSDFNNPLIFTRGRDALALITGPLSGRTLQHARPLLEWARTSATGAEFAGKVATAHFSSDQKRTYLQVFKDVLTKIAGTAPSDEVLWQFLRHLYLLSYDFDVPGGKDEAAILTMLDMAQTLSATPDAQAVWEGLIVQAQEWNKTAGTYTAPDLPERLRSAVQPRRSEKQREAVSKLQEHCALILETIKTELAPGVQFPRSALLDLLVDAVEVHRVVLVQGAPGSGKSSIVKMLIEALPDEIVPFAFKAQELNHPHLHQFLTSMGVRLSVAQLKSEFSLLPRKLLLVDGAERLFEISNLETFQQLIRQLNTDDSWSVVITCRESSAKSLKEHLLAQWCADVTVIEIPLLSDEELGWVSAQAPRLVPLISNHRLRNLFRLPFILSLAWKAFPTVSSTATVSEIDERQFKDIVWQDYVERKTQAQGGLPIRRGQCLITVAVERARQMSLFVSSESRDAEVLKALVDDGILICSGVGCFAPAHDVLEDWAISRFIAQEFETKTADLSRFLEAVGTEPAMRRGFRLWLTEALANHGNQHVKDFVLTAFQRDNVPPVWRDEIAVAVLQSENAGEFIKAMECLLLEQGKVLYRRLVHVLKTACKGPNESLLSMYGLATFRNHLVLGSVFVVPTGSGWRELILLTHRNLTAFDLHDVDVVRGLLKDWSHVLGSSTPLPVEAQAVAQICLKYWELLTAPNLYADRMEQDFLQLLFKIPHAAPDEVTALIRSALADELPREHHSRTVLEHVLKSIECQPLCTYLPDLVIEVAEKAWLPTEEEQESFPYRHELEGSFGLINSMHFQYFPESALQGPFMFLLVAHPDAAVDFIVGLVNKATLSYSLSELGNEVATIHLPCDTGSRTLIASPRLWAMYRQMMPGPQVLECALMALEAWLLGQAKQGNDIKAVYRKILDTTSSAATVAVLASGATAYPAAVGDVILPILGVPDFIRWDYQRSHQEKAHISDMKSMMGFPTGGIQEIYYQERKDSDSLPHRKSNLEELAFRLQFTPLREKVWAILDHFYSDLPAEEKQSEADKNWRIALHRMDARHCKAEKGPDSDHVLLVPGAPAPDLQQYIAKVTEDLAPGQRRLRLAMWGMNQFLCKPQSFDPFPAWRDALREAQVLWEQMPTVTEEISLGLSGPCFVAAYLIRAHYNELDPLELEWCRQVVVEEVRCKDAERTFETRISKSSFDGSRPCAMVLPLLLKNVHDSQTQNEIEECLAVAVTHTSEEVRDYAAEGIRSWLWEIDPLLAKACIGGLYELAGVESKIRLAERRHQEFSTERQNNAILAAMTDIRTRIVKRETIATLNAPVIDLETHDWPELLDALAMIKPDSDDPDLRAFVMANLAAVLREAEVAENWKSGRHAHFEFQYAFAKLFASFALKRSITEAAQIELLLRDYVDRCPKYLAVLMEALPYEEDKVRSGDVFWGIWRAVSEPIFQHKLLRGSARVWRYDEMRKLIRILLFADIEWKEGVKEWEPVSSNRNFVETAASLVGDTPAGFGALLSLLSSVGQVFLPDAVRLLADSVEKAAGSDLLDDPNAEFQLEILLRKVCYGFGTDIRQRPDLHRAVILLLDRLVERGSHTGFRLRDYMIAPLPMT